MGLDKRKFSRFLAQHNAFVALGHSFARVGKVKNISRGGLTFEYVSDNNSEGDASQLYVFLSEHGFHLSDIPCKIVYDIPVGSPYVYKTFNQTFITKRCGVVFGNIPNHKKSQLDFFLKNHTTGLA
ncbi:MAG: PilZ domain-containing protein [Desulfobacteraceae bacterium]|nr:PilZ domain-containing protein [Desulfobacteraceae bacterium]